jgi:hypothetical protein
MQGRTRKVRGNLELFENRGHKGGSSLVPNRRSPKAQSQTHRMGLAPDRVQKVIAIHPQPKALHLQHRGHRQRTLTLSACLYLPAWAACLHEK